MGVVFKGGRGGGGGGLEERRREEGNGHRIRETIGTSFVRTGFVSNRTDFEFYSEQNGKATGGSEPQRDVTRSVSKASLRLLWRECR